jgi:uncharacterized protein YndB with AHSA1/START domain
MTQNFAKAEMLIRRGIEEVFNAFINPEITTQIWFTKSSGKLEAGTTVTWNWEMYNHSVEVEVLEVIPLQKIKINWGNYDNPSIVEWTFREMKNGTFVSISNEIVQPDPEKLLAEVRDSTEGFTLVLANLKALLEHGIQLQLVADRFPGQ